MGARAGFDLPYFGRTICVDVIEDVVVVMHSEECPSEEEWNGCMATAEATNRRSPSGVRVLVATLGGRPNSRQRASYAERLGRCPVAVITDSAAVRTVAQYMNVFNPFIRTFSALDAALEFLGRPGLPVSGRMRRFREWFEPSPRRRISAP
jgi:hypothetical protein